MRVFVMYEFNPRSYIYLDSTEDRRLVGSEIAKSRAAVLQVIEDIPQSEWYTPRYHSWTLAAMLGHLHTVDYLALLSIQAALLNVHPVIPMRWVHRSNALMARVYRNRVIPTTIKGIQNREKQILAMVNNLPIDKLSKQVYYPPFEQYTTIERILQDYFIYHWREHLQTICTVEGIQPPSLRSDKA